MLQKKGAYVTLYNRTVIISICLSFDITFTIKKAKLQFKFSVTVYYNRIIYFTVLSTFIYRHVQFRKPIHQLQSPAAL